MLAGMGGVSYHRLVAAVSEAGGFGCLGASTMGHRGDDRRDRQGPRAHRASRSASTCSPPSPATWSRQGRTTSSTAAPRCSSPGSACPATWSTSATSNNVLVVSMCGKVRHAIAAVEAGCDIVVAAGHRGRRPHRARSRRWRSSRRSSTRSASGCRSSPPAASSTAAAWPPSLALGADGVWVGTRFIATPEARAVPGYKEALLPHPRGRHRHHPRVHRQDLPGGAQRVDEALRRAPRGAEAVPAAGVDSAKAAANHLGAPDEHRGRPDREFFPAGQGVGAIDELVPAGELVRGSWPRPRQ